MQTQNHIVPPIISQRMSFLTEWHAAANRPRISCKSAEDKAETGDEDQGPIAYRSTAAQLMPTLGRM